MSMYKQKEFNPQELRCFQELQRLAYQCVQEVAETLQQGDTENQAVERMTLWMEKRGITEFFHKPYAWFGERTAFDGFWIPAQFFPTNRKLFKGMPVILDIAPFSDGYISDIGYSFMFGEDTAEHQQMRKDLLDYRELILESVLAEKTFRTIYQEVDAMIADHGYQRIHSRYPFRVLAHRVAKVKRTWKSKYTLGRFGIDGLLYLANQTKFSQFLSGTDPNAPVWNDRVESDHKPLAGLWAVEPHIGWNGIGVKWEELLVITDSDAYWLDDQVPHVMEAKQKGWLTHQAVA